MFKSLRPVAYVIRAQAAIILVASCEFVRAADYADPLFDAHLHENEDRLGDLPSEVARYFGWDNGARLFNLN